MTSAAPRRRQSGARTILLFGALLAGLVFLAGWLFRSSGGDLDRAPDASVAQTPGAIASPDVGDGEAGAAPKLTGEREVVAVELGKGTGRLEVEVRYADGSAAADVGVSMREAGKDQSQRRWSRTDARGLVLFVAVPEGRAVVTLDRAIVGEAGVANVVRDRTANLRLTVQPRLCLAGVVLGFDDAPVAGAEVIACDEGVVNEDAAAVARTDGAGRFEARTAFRAAWVGARAAGHGASRLQRVVWTPDEVTMVTIRLPPGGGLMGTVSGPDGKPIADAMVRVGNGDLDTIVGTQDLASPLPAHARTDDTGRYRIDSMVEGKQAVVARAVGFAPWTGACAIAAGQTVELPIELVRESRVVGRVDDGAGKPVAGAIVGCGAMRSPIGVRTATDRDGRFTLGEIGPGHVQVYAVAPELGSASAELDLQPGAEHDVVLVLRRDGSLCGHVLFDDGMPVADARVEIRIQGDLFTWLTDPRGAFDIPHVRGGEGVLLVQHPDANEVRQQVAVPANVTLTMTRKRPGRGVIQGRIVAEDGTGVRAADVSVHCVTSPLNSEESTTDASGGFRIAMRYEGMYLITARKTGFPATQLPEHHLDDGATWDAGDIALVRGGSIRVVPQRPLEAGITVSVYYLDYGFAAYIPKSASDLVSDLVRPGKCRVFLTGDGIASEGHEVEVVAGHETVVPAPCTKGYQRSIVVQLTAGGSAPSKWITSYLKRDGSTVALLSGAWKDGRCTLRYCLASGVYEGELTSGSERKTVALVVADRDEDAPFGVAW